MRSVTRKMAINVEPECFPCFLRQVVLALRNVDLDSRDKIEVLKETLKDVEKTDPDLTPAHTTTHIHRRVREMLGCDPFEEVKQRYNRVGLSLYNELRGIVDSSDDPLMVATRLSVAGNAIDFGIYTDIDIHGEIKRALNEQFGIDHFSVFKEKVITHRQILYLLDNAGEIVFDRLLIETLTSMGKEVTAVVKGSPVINDATMKDAIETGLLEICQVVDNGSDAIGTIIQWASQDFRALYKSAPFVISKGQGNFETLLGDDKEISFLFQSKCDVVSSKLGVRKDSMIIFDNGAAS